MSKEINKIILKYNKIKKILIAGVSYTEDVDDIRNSRSLDMVNYILGKGQKLKIYDPVVKNSSFKKVKIIKKLKNLKHYDLIIFNVKHKQFKRIDFNKINKKTFIVDTNNILGENQIKDILKKKIKLKIIGRGDI